MDIRRIACAVLLTLIVFGYGHGGPKQYADYSQGSGFVASDSLAVDNLVVLAKVWGFAKYHHPVFSTDSLDVDRELFELLPKVSDATKEERNAVLAAWIDGLGEFASNKDAMLKEIAENGYTTSSDTGWLSDDVLGEELAATLHDLRYAERPKPSRYAYNAAMIAGFTSDDKETVIVLRNGKRVKSDIKTITSQEHYERQNDRDKEKTYYDLLDDGSVGYLYPGKFKNSDGAAIMEKFADTRGIVIDMRCYPSDFMPFEFVGRYLVPDVVQHVTFTKAVGKLPGYFETMPQSLGRKNDNYYKGKIVVIVDEQTISQAEYTTMAFQAAGADGNFVELPLPRDFRTTFWKRR